MVKVMFFNFKRFVFFFSIILFGFTFQSNADDTKTDDGSEQITTVICHVINMAQGDIGKTIGILVIISLAIGLFLGKITWGVAISVAVGMGVLFGAGNLVGFLANTDTGTINTGNPCKKTST